VSNALRFVKERRKTTCAMAWVVFFVGDDKKWGRDVKNMEEIDGDSEFFLNFAK